MPAVVPIIASAFAAVGSAVATFGAQLAFTAGISAGISAWGTLATVASLAVSLTSKPPSLESAGYDLSTALAGASAPLPIVFGRAAVGGSLIYRESGGTKNRDLYMASVMSIGPIAAFENFYIENRQITWGTSPVRAGSATGLSTSTGAVGLTNSKLYANALRGAVSLGEWSDTRTFNSFMGGGVAGAHASKPFTGLSILGLKATLDDKGEAFEGGKEPSGYSVVRGQYLYDPRLDATQPGGSGSQRANDPSTFTYSTNPILAGLNWAMGRRLSGGRLLWGIGADLATEIDLPPIIAAANIADANGWTVGGLVTNRDDAFAVLSQLWACGGATPITRGAKLSIYQNAPRASVITVNPEDVISVRLTNATSLRERINRVVPSYTEESQFWAKIDAPAITAQTYLDEDGGIEKSDDFDLPLATSATAVKQLGSYYLANCREGINVDLEGKPKLLNADVGDCLYLNVPEVAITGQKFLVVGRDWKPNNQTVSLSLRSETDAKHAWALGQTSTAPASPTLSTFDKTNPDQPGASAWSITATSITAPNGSTSPAMVVTGATDNPLADQIQFSYRVVGAGSWTTASTVDRATTRFEITGLASGQVYEAGVSYVCGVYASPIRALPSVTVGQAIATTVIPGAIDWTSRNTPGVSPLVNVPPALTVGSDGRIPPANITVGTGQTLTQFATTVNTANTSLNNGVATLTTATTDLDNRLDAVEPVVLANDARLTSVENRTTAVESGKTSVTDFNALKLRTDTAEGTISAHTGQISTLNTTVAGKASASDLSALGVRVTNAEGVNTAQNSRLTTVETDVAGKASASSVAVLAATVSSQSAMNDNATFALGLTGGIPTSWSSWNDGTGTIVTGQVSDKAVRFVAATDTDKGILQWGRRKASPGWFVAEATVTLVSGKLEGAGLFVVAGDATQTGTGASQILHFYNEAGGDGTVGRTYTFTKLFQLADANLAQVLVYAMTNWAGVGSRRAKTLDWHSCLVREAEAGEIETGVARGGFASVSAKIADVASVAATATAAVASSVSTLTAAIPAAGGNLLQNTDFQSGIGGWIVGGEITPPWSTMNVNYPDASWHPLNENCLGINMGLGGYTDIYSSMVAVEAGKWYEFSGYVAAHRANLEIFIGWTDASGSGFSYPSTGQFTPLTGGNSLAAYSRPWVKAQAPSGAVNAFVIFRKHATNSGTDSWMWVCRPQFAECSAGQVAPSAYRPGNSRQLTAQITDAKSVAVDAQGKANAKVGVTLDVNGYVSGWSSVNNGTSSSFALLASAFSVRSPGSGDRWELRDGITYVYDTANSVRAMYGKNFGGSDKLQWWTGPSSVVEGSETKANAYVYISSVAPRFGGTDTPSAAAVGFILSATSPVQSAINSASATISCSLSGPSPVGSVTYKWTQIGGTTCTISNPNGSSTNVNVGHTAGDFATFQVTVTDNERVKTATVRVIFRSTA